MSLIYTVIGTPLGWIMWACYQLVRNYGFALFLFTIISRSATLPLTLKQQKSTAKMALIQPKIQELQKKYANNREKLTEEMNKLYQQEGYNPMSGCLPMLIPLLIMFGLIDVIYKPLKHILHLPTEVIAQIEEIFATVTAGTASRGYTLQVQAIQLIQENVEPWLAIGQENIDKILSLNMNFLGINLGITPDTSMFGEIFSTGFNPILLVPILSFLTAIAFSLISMKTTMAANPAAAGGAGASMKGMMLITPIFSLMIAFSVPAGVGVYWTFSNLYAIAQSLLLYKFRNPQEMAEQARKEREEREEQERLERIEAKKKAKEAGLDTEKALSQKEINRRKLAEARKRDAEKYGETYKEVTDDDIR